MNTIKASLVLAASVAALSMVACGDKDGDDTADNACNACDACNACNACDACNACGA